MTVMSQKCDLLICCVGHISQSVVPAPCNLILSEARHRGINDGRWLSVPACLLIYSCNVTRRAARGPLSPNRSSRPLRRKHKQTRTAPEAWLVAQPPTRLMRASPGPGRKTTAAGAMGAALQSGLRGARSCSTPPK